MGPMSNEAVKKVADKASRVENHPAAAALAAVGHIANGLVHALIGLIAFSVARGAGGSADQAGAMRAIDSTPLGSITLWVVGIALVALGVYSIAVGIGDWGHDKFEALKAGGRAVAYFAVAFVALTYATGGSADGEETTKSISGQLLSTGWGAVLLIIVGIVAFAIGVAMIYRGVTKGFMDDVEVSGRFRKWFVPLGMAGYIAKGIAVATVGVLFGVAVWKRDPEASGGLDGALKALAEMPGGKLVLVAIGVGLILYGIFCLAKARTVAPSRREF